MDTNIPNPSEGYFHKRHTIYWSLVAVAMIIFVIVVLRWKHADFQTQFDSIARALKPEAIISIDPSTQVAKVGQTFTVNVMIDTSSKPVDGVDVYSLHYDPTVLKLIDQDANATGAQIKPGDALPLSPVNTADESKGLIKFSQVAKGGTTFTGKGLLATIEFRPIKVGQTTLEFDFTPGSTTDTNAAHKGKDQLDEAMGATIDVQ